MSNVQIFGSEIHTCSLEIGCWILDIQTFPAFQLTLFPAPAEMRRESFLDVGLRVKNAVSNIQ